jgi:hypothetical protein
LRISVLVRQIQGGRQKAQKNGSANSHANANGHFKLTSSSRVIGRLRDEFDYRLYSAAQIRQLFASVPQLELQEVFDFWYDLDDPQKLDNELSDVVFILRRR